MRSILDFWKSFLLFDWRLDECPWPLFSVIFLYELSYNLFSFSFPLLLLLYFLYCTFRWVDKVYLMLVDVEGSFRIRRAQTKTPFPLCPLVAARVEHCIAWVRVKPSFCIHHLCHLDRFTVCLLLSMIKLTLTPLLLTGICFDHWNLHTHTQLCLYVQWVCTLSSSLGDQDSLVDPWIPHNTICWLINNSILSVCKHVWIQSHLPFPQPPLNSVCCVLELGLACVCVYGFIVCVD